MEDAGLTPGALLGSAGTAALGDRGLSAVLIIGGWLVSKRMVKKSQSGSKEFTEWFVNARNGVITKMEAAIADPAVSQQKLDEIYEDSRSMAAYIRGHNAMSSTFEQAFPWMVQSAAAALSFITGISQNISQYIIAGRVGAAEQKKMLRSVSFNQSLMTIERYHDRLRKTFESIQTFQQALCQIEPGVCADTLDQALTHNVELEEASGSITVHRFVDAKGVMHEIGDIPFIKGEVHHIVGESGSGKSALLNYLRIFYGSHDIPFSFAAIESSVKDQSLGFRLAKQLCQGKNKRMARYIEEQLNATGLVSTEVPISQIWEDWKAYHAPNSKRTESRTNKFIDGVVLEYTLFRMNIQSDHILEESGSTGENLRAQLMLLDLDADVIVLDEIISNVDPYNLQKMIEYLVGELGEDIHHKTVISVTHKPEVLRLFHQLMPEGTNQNITVIYPDVSFTEPLSNRFVEVNLDNDPNQIEAHIVDQTINRFKAIFSKPIAPKDVHSELYDFWEEFSLPFELPLEGKLKVIAALTQYRDYWAGVPLTEIERYYLGGLIDVMIYRLCPDYNWQERQTDPFWRQATYLKYQMFASIPQVYLEFNKGSFEYHYLDDNERTTVPKDPIPPFLDAPHSVAVEPGAAETLAVIKTLTAMVRRIDYILPEDMFKHIQDFVYEIDQHPFIAPFGVQLLSIVHEFQDILFENRLRHNDCVEYAVIMLKLAEWAGADRAIVNQINASRDSVLSHFGELDKINFEHIDVEWYLRNSRQLVA